MTLPLARLTALLVLCGLLLLPKAGSSGESFTVATYNLDNYLDLPAGTRPAKSPEAKAKVQQSLRTLNADVVTLQEMGETNALLELRANLRSQGLDYPFWDHLTGHDNVIHLAVLSKFPIIGRRHHTNDSYLLFGRRFMVSRGFSELDIQVAPNLSFTVLTAHLKSRRASPEADEAEMREQEALLLREKIDRLLQGNPEANLIVLGDFNDSKDSRTLRALIGRGRTALIDTRPAERNGDDQPNPNPRYPPRNVTWTYHYGREDTYSRIDFILLSQAMAKRWNKNETWVLTLPNWGIGSDHRPIMAGFFIEPPERRRASQQKELVTPPGDKPPPKE
jgi:endonuclease/exonuclease/phosphatase family metal-dependent hydrolase